MCDAYQSRESYVRPAIIGLRKKMLGRMTYLNVAMEVMRVPEIILWVIVIPVTDIVVYK